MNKYKKFFDLAHSKGLKNIQITEITIIEKGAKLINGKLINEDYANNVHYNIQSDYNKGTIKTTTNYLDENVIDILLEKGKYLKNKKIEILKDLSKNNNDNSSKNILDIEDAINENTKFNKLLQDNDVLTCYISSKYSKVRIINELGVDISSSSLQNGFSSEVIVKRNGEVKVGCNNILFNDNINYTEFVNNLINETLMSLNEYSIESKKYKVLFKNSEMSIILRKLVPYLNLEKIKNKTSFLDNKLNKKIFSDKLTIIESPLDKSMPGYRVFDDEGTSTYNKTIVENGNLITYLCDNKTAKENNVNSTGNSYGGVSTRNMYIKPGNYSYDELLEKLDNGIIVTDIFSNYNIDTKDSKASFQAYGLLVENGKVKGGLKSFIVTTSYFDLFNNIEEIGNDLLFNNVTCASPSVIVNDVDITI
ncbi:MAG: TldD/PmbA family protein [Bacilli bacterium]|nr:TldD/PmbA family protein [Bacilli bacterium]